MSTEPFGWDATEPDDFSQDATPLDGLGWDATELDDFSQDAMQLADFQPRGNPKPQPSQRTAAGVISCVWWDYGLDPPSDSNPPTPAQLVNYLTSGDCPATVSEEYTTTAVFVWANASNPPPFPRGFYGHIIPNHWEESIVWFDAAWDALPEDVQPVHPLLPLVEGYIAHAAPMVVPEQRPKGVMPRFTAVRHQRAIMEYLPGLDQPSLPGLVMPANAPALSYLPGLEPNAPKSPALMLALFDRGGGSSLAGNGHVQPAARIFVETLLSIPTAARNGNLQQMTFTIREIVEDWLQWSVRQYRPTRDKYGGALERALAEVHNIAVPIQQDIGSPGFYRPIMVQAAEGRELNRRLSVLVRVPEGKVGPPIDRLMLRQLGTSATAWRSYLSLVFEWDKKAGYHGKPINPWLPNVRRTEGGIVARADGSPRIEKDKPVYNGNHPRAIRTGGYERNPARIPGNGGALGYPEYSGDDLVALAFPQWVMDDPAKRRDKRRDAVRAIQRIEEQGGCIIEETGSGKGKRYRVMPPTDFDSSKPK